MNEDFDEDDFPEADELVARFELMIQHGDVYFFDVEEFELIINFYLESDNYERTNLAIKHAVNQHPACVTFQLKKAQLFASTDNTKRALDILDTLSELESSNAELHMTRGAIYSKLRQFEKSIAEFRRALSLDSENDEIFLNIGLEYEKTGNYDKAIHYFGKALELNPENESCLNELAFCFELTDQTSRAIDFFLKFLDDNPYSIDGWFNLGIAYNTLGLYEKAIDAYDYAIAIEPAFASAYFNKANSQANIELYKEAINTYLETFEHEEPEALTYYYIGECYEKLEDFHQAIAYYEKAIQSEGQLNDALIGLGMAHDQLGNFRLALKFIGQAVEADPQNPEYHYFMGDLLRKNGLHADAVAEYVLVSELASDNTMIWVDLAELYDLLGRYGDALKTLQQGLIVQPENGAIHYRLTVSYARLGYQNEARQHFISGLELDHDGYNSVFEAMPQLRRKLDYQKLIYLHVHKKKV